MLQRTYASSKFIGKSTIRMQNSHSHKALWTVCYLRLSTNPGRDNFRQFLTTTSTNHINGNHPRVLSLHCCINPPWQVLLQCFQRLFLGQSMQIKTDSVPIATYSGRTIQIRLKSNQDRINSLASLGSECVGKVANIFFVIMVDYLDAFLRLRELTLKS